MSMTGFIAWFCSALVVTLFLETTIDNMFLTSFFVALVVGFLGAKE